jgi:hypothetical protein
LELQLEAQEPLERKTGRQVFLFYIYQIVINKKGLIFIFHLEVSLGVPAFIL